MNPTLLSAYRSYQDRHTTLSGYTMQAIELLEIRAINIGFLADEMGVKYSSLRDCILKLRKAGLITIPTVDPRSQPK